MTWPDLLLQRDPGTQALAAVLADLLHVSASDIAIVDGLGLLGNRATASSPITVQRQPLLGAARLLLRFSVVDPSIASRSDGADTRLDLVKRVAATLDSAVLVEDGTLEPSGYLRVSPSGTVERIVIDDDRLAQEGSVHVHSGEQAPAAESPSRHRPAGAARTSA